MGLIPEAIIVGGSSKQGTAHVPDMSKRPKGK